MIEQEPQEALVGRYSSDMNPDLAVTVAAVTTGLTLSAAANAESQAQARQFIVEAGAAVLGGHSPVNPAPDQIIEAGGGEMYDAG